MPRGDELGADGKISAVHLLAWLEHGRWEAAALKGTGMDDLFTKGRIAVVRSQKVAFFSKVGLGDTVTLGIGIGRIGTTSLEILQSMWKVPVDPMQVPECVAILTITAVALGADRRPAPVPEAVRSLARQVPANPQLADFELLPVHAPDFCWQCDVRPSEIDLFAHVNHACYALWADDVRQLRDRAMGRMSQELKRIAVDYVRETVLGERIEVRLQPLGLHDLAAEVRVGDEVRARLRLQTAD